MNKNLLIYYMAALVTFLWSCDYNKGSHLSAETFFHTPAKSHFRISPNGQFVSFLKDHKGLKSIFVLDLNTGLTEHVLESNELDIQSAFWANDRELVFLLKRGSSDRLRLVSLDLETKRLKKILDLPSVRLRWVEPIQVINSEVVISLNDRDSSVFDVYRLNIQTGKRSLIAENPGNIVRWLTDYDGKLRLGVVSDGLTETLLVRDNEDEEFKPVLSSLYKSTVKPLGFAAYSRHRIFALSNRNRDKLALVEIDLRTGKEVRILYQHPDVDLNGEGYSKQSGRMEYVEYDAERREIHSFDSKVKDAFSKVQRLIPEYSLKLISRDSLFNGFVIHASQDVDPGATYYYNYKDNNLLKLTDENSLLNQQMLSPMKPVTYLTRDSVELSGFLTMPKNLSGKVPAIVIPPAGVNSRAVWGFNPEVQFLAAQGFAVLQVNTRGLVGFGKEKWRAGFKKWGSTMQDDVTDATRWLIREGIADSSRIGIYGSGLGGYFALHGSCYTADLYACAASYSGITNLFTYLKEVPPYYQPYRQKIYETVAHPIIDSEYIRKHSPIFHADKIKRPIFIAQGGLDTRSNVNETNQYVKSLRAKGVPVTYMLKTEEGHKFENETNQILFYNELASFFNKNLR